MFIWEFPGSFEGITETNPETNIAVAPESNGIPKMESNLPIINFQGGIPPDIKDPLILWDFKAMWTQNLALEFLVRNGVPACHFRCTIFLQRGPISIWRDVLNMWFQRLGFTMVFTIEIFEPQEMITRSIFSLLQFEVASCHEWWARQPALAMKKTRCCRWVFDGNSANSCDLTSCYEWVFVL